MSKSRGNVVNPGKVVDKFGADTLRLYLMFMGPYQQTMPWSSKGVEGCWRFLNRSWRLFVRGFEKRPLTDREKRLVSKLIKRVEGDTLKLDNNTAIAALMEGLNDFSKLSSQSAKKKLPKELLDTFCLLLAPFAPFFAEEVWVNLLGNKFSVHQQSWPKFAKKLVEDEEVTIVVQVNGKLRGQIRIKSQITNHKSQVEKLAKRAEGVDKHLAGKKIKKTVFVPGRLINFVI